MDNFRHRRARWWIVTGFSLSAVGAIITFVRLATTHGFQFAPFSSIILSLINPLMMVVTVWIWWWLSSISPTNELQRRAFMKAFYGLAILYLLSAVLWSLIIFPNWEETYQGFNDGTFALEGFGSVVAFVGFSLLAFEFTVGFEDAEIVHVGEPVSEDD